MRASITAQATRTQRTIEGNLLARLLRPWVRSPQASARVDLRPAAAAGLLEVSPGPSRTVRAEHLREYWRRRYVLAEMMLYRTVDAEVARRLVAVRDEARRRWMGSATGAVGTVCTGGGGVVGDGEGVRVNG